LPGTPQAEDGQDPGAGQGAVGRSEAVPVVSAYPNPFNPQTTIAYNIPQSGMVRVTIYDVTGRVMRRLVNGTKSAGDHTVVWNGRDESGREVSTGIYFVRFEAGGVSQNHKIVFMK
jgi:hypothetical protein